MNLKPTSVIGRYWTVSLLLLLAFTALAQAGDLKIEAQLIWGTNDPQSPDPKLKPVDPEIQKKLGALPLKWANYFQVCKKRLSVPAGAEKKVTMSDKCEVKIRNLGDSQVEVSLFGKGTEVWKRTQPLAKGEILVWGGNAPNSTAWFVALKRVD